MENIKKIIPEWLVKTPCSLVPPSLIARHVGSVVQGWLYTDRQTIRNE